jgi:hypothetical protein
MKVILLSLLLGSLFGCTPKSYYSVTVENPVYYPNTEFKSYEDLTSPKFPHLIEKYRLDTVFHGETDEMKRILLLRHWIKSVISINDFGDPYPGGDSAEGILDAALKGQGFHCGHYMVVQNAVLNAYGYVTRTLGAGPGVAGGPDGHHGIDEVWSNQYQKWFLTDAKYDHHFEKNGIPLSALEIREEFLKNKAADIVKVKGPDRVPFDVDAETGLSKVQNAQTYTWIEWHGYNNMCTAGSKHEELLLMYADDYFRNHIWIWNGHPHWAYAQPKFMVKVDDRDKIYWTPNTIASTVSISSKVAHIEIQSWTPNLQSYDMKEQTSGEWTATTEKLDYELHGNGAELFFRTRNLAGITGPEHRIIIQSR